MPLFFVNVRIVINFIYFKIKMCLIFKIMDKDIFSQEIAKYFGACI